jgi:hypothetical protein
MERLRNADSQSRRHSTPESWSSTTPRTLLPTTPSALSIDVGSSTKREGVAQPPSQP